MTNTVVHLRPFGDDAALALLQGGEVFASAADFGRRVGWNRQKASRCLKKWADTGHIKIGKTQGKTMVSAPCPRVRGQRTTVSAPVTQAVTAPVTLPPSYDMAVRCPPAVQVPPNNARVEYDLRPYLDELRARAAANLEIGRRSHYRMVFFAMGAAFCALLAIAAILVR